MRTRNGEVKTLNQSRSEHCNNRVWNENICGEEDRKKVLQFSANQGDNSRGQYDSKWEDHKLSNSKYLRGAHWSVSSKENQEVLFIWASGKEGMGHKT